MGDGSKEMSQVRVDWGEWGADVDLPWGRTVFSSRDDTIPAGVAITLGVDNYGLLTGELGRWDDIGGCRCEEGENDGSD